MQLEIRQIQEKMRMGKDLQSGNLITHRIVRLGLAVTQEPEVLAMLKAYQIEMATGVSPE